MYVFAYCICGSTTGSPKELFFLKMLKKKLLNIFSNFFFYLKVQSFRLIMGNNFIHDLTMYGFIPRSLIWCWWRFTYTFCHSSNILGCTQCFWLFTLWFIDFFQNPYAIFAHILQHYHDFQIPALFKHIHNHIRSAEG